MNVNRRFALLVLFALSGFSGLIYESLWTHYLKLFLGHAAYAQVLVLAIFMGGMALGSWISSRFSAGWHDPLAAYALSEAAIGLAAVFFHPLFDGAVRLSYDRILPALGTPLGVTLFKWALSSLMILPQTVLLGMTFPLMTAGFLRRFPEGSGRSLSLLYFVNSIGGAVGVVVSGFLLIRFTGLQGTGIFAGMVNLFVGFAVWHISRERRTGEVLTPHPEPAVRSPGGAYRILLLVSCLTGTASFLYEIGWTRMLSLVLGGSTHSFELMLSAFILGLAFGSFWVRSRIDRTDNPVRLLTGAQIAMGAFVLLSLAAYGTTFSLMARLVNILPKTDGGYALFSLSSEALALYLMLPATFCAGMTLPLITHALLKNGRGEGSIGAVYAANTAGAIIGIMLGVHVAMPLLGLKGMLLLGAGLDIGLGVLLAMTLDDRIGRRFAATTALAAIGAFALVGYLVEFDGYKMGSGVYRYGNFVSPEEEQLVYHRDGKTATVSVFASGTDVNIRTNGKTDAGIQVDRNLPPSSDEPTTVLLAALPMAFNPAARTAAAIGFGSGLTTATLLANDDIAAVDTIEIEPAMVEGARHFLPVNAAAYEDPRSRIVIDDAKTFFSAEKKKYDIIISEPSNPWVSGVAGLFSEEFYRQARRHLNEGGVFCQWLQLYEIDEDQVLSVLKALSGSFSDFEIYSSVTFDLVIIAGNTDLSHGPDFGVLARPGLWGAVKRAGISGPRDLAVRRVGNKAFFLPMIKAFSGRANSDYFPFVDQNAARTRFLQTTAADLMSFVKKPLPLVELLAGSNRPFSGGVVTLEAENSLATDAYAARLFREYLQRGAGHGSAAMPGDDYRKTADDLLRLFGKDCRSGTDERVQVLYQTAGIGLIPNLDAAEMDGVWRRLEAGACVPGLSQRERAWIRMLKAITRRDGRTMEDAASEILGVSADLPPGPLSYVVGVGMTGQLMQGKRREALDLWDRYRGQLYCAEKPSLFFRYLTAAARYP